jgi:hypothetical protein
MLPVLNEKDSNDQSYFFVTQQVPTCSTANLQRISHIVAFSFIKKQRNRTGHIHSQVKERGHPNHSTTAENPIQTI